MDIALYIAETLENNPKVAVRGLGSFTLTTHASVIDEETQSILPPRKIYFMETEVDEAAVQPLINHIHKQRNISEPSCIWFINNWVEKLQAELEERKSAERKPLGTFSMIAGNVLVLAEEALPDESSPVKAKSWLSKLSLGRAAATPKESIPTKEQIKPEADKSKKTELSGAEKESIATVKEEKLIVKEAKAPVQIAAAAPTPEAQPMTQEIEGSKKASKGKGLFGLFGKKKAEPVEPVEERKPLSEKTKSPELVSEDSPIAESKQATQEELVKESEKALPAEETKKKSKAIKTKKTELRADALIGEPEKGPKKRKPVVAITAIVIVLAGAGSGYYFFKDKLSSVLHLAGVNDAEEQASEQDISKDSVATASLDTAAEHIDELPTSTTTEPKAELKTAKQTPVKASSEPVETSIATTQPTEAPKPSTPPPSPVKQEGPLDGLSMDADYQIIVGSYATEEIARKTKSQLHNANPEVTFYIIQAEGHYRISIGGFDDYDKTKKILSYCKRTIAQDCWVFKQS